MGNFTKAQTGVSAILGGSTSVSASFASNPGAGHIVCVGVVFTDAPTTVTVQDGNSNVYTVDPTNSGSTNALAGQIWLAYMINTPANAHKTITATFGKLSAGASIFIDDFASASTPALGRAAVLASGTGTSITSPTITVTTGDDLLYSIASTQGNLASINSPWTANEGGFQGGNSSSWLVSAGANTAVNYTNSNDIWNCLGMSFTALSYYPRGAPVTSGYSVLRRAYDVGG